MIDNNNLGINIPIDLIYIFTTNYLVAYIIMQDEC